MSNKTLPVVGLLVNASVWGASWIAFKGMQSQGLYALWATAAIFGFAMLVTWGMFRHSMGEVFRTRSLIGVAIAAGITNVSFNSAMALGDVVRVTLLFYLMPIWAAFLAVKLLGEPLTTKTWMRIGLGLLGAGFVLWRPDVGLPIPHSLADLLAIIGGVGFALNNIMLRHAKDATDAGRSQAMFVGGTTMCVCLGFVFLQLGYIPAPPAFNASNAAGLYTTLAIWTVLFLAANFGVQYGASRLPANITALVMLTEIVVAAGSSVALGASVLRWQDIVGGLLIIAAPWLIKDAPKQTS